MRGRDDIIPFYDLVASITAEEFGHVELVSATINLLQNGGVPDDAEPKDHPLDSMNQAAKGLRHHFLNVGASTLVGNSQAAPLDRRQRLFQRQLGARHAAQLLPGIRRAHG